MKVAACLRSTRISSTNATRTVAIVTVILSDPASRRFLTNLAAMQQDLLRNHIARAKTLSGGFLLPYRTRALSLSRKSQHDQNPKFECNSTRSPACSACIARPKHAWQNNIKACICLRRRAYNPPACVRARMIMPSLHVSSDRSSGRTKTCMHSYYIIY